MQNNKDIKLVVVGAGCVGLGTVALLAQHSEVTVKATIDSLDAVKTADYVVLTEAEGIEAAIDAVLESNPKAVIVARCNLPAGYTRSLYVKYHKKFLAEGKDSRTKLRLISAPLFECIDGCKRKPSRIVVGYPKMLEALDEENEAIRAIAGNHVEEEAREFAALLKAGAKNDVEPEVMGMKAAESLV